ncbi:MAG TPA: exodeoxyribonuclease III [Candidatus Nanoarchaeia archaeon]|nr:exodeoxyribonuclease III [Candidatus Nanoarchaeia archaeon]
MKILSWNVNGIRSCSSKGLLNFLKKENADIVCLQEVKSDPFDVDFSKLNYEMAYFPAQKKGYSGVLTLYREKPLFIIRGLGKKEIDREGRVLTLEYKHFYLINAYFPHTQRELLRLPFKLKFNKAFERFCQKLRAKKPVIIGGDINVAHQEIDLRNPKQNKKNAGFTPVEREWIGHFLELGYVDAFREFVKEGGHYTWWTYRNNARKRNIGWRIDYFLVSEELCGKLKNCTILKEVCGSDHCPISLVMGL